MDRSWIHAKQFSSTYINGVKDFMQFIRARFDDNANVLCPCRRCLNQILKPQSHVEDHILIYGMSSTYSKWIHHGEPFDAEVSENPSSTDENLNHNEHVTMDGFSLNEDDDDDDRFPELIGDLYTAAEQGGEGPMLAAVIEDAKRELYPGCARFSRFSFLVKLLHIKSFYRISNTAFSAVMKVLSLAFPQCELPQSYNEAKNYLRELGLGYDSIHVCKNNCVLFRKEYAKNNDCPVCGASRWKDTEGRKRVPEKVLRYFPLIPRLKRMFVSKNTAEDTQWHKLKRQPIENTLSHPADGEAWKDFDRKYPWFADDARNLRLGISTDGFNPFGNMSISYSMWPVFVVPYNLPPWACMDQSNFMMSLLIPGPKSPGKDFDVFLQPLIDDLLELWKGVRTYDAFSARMFNLHAAIIWCIHDYPALSTLSGRTTRGYFACIHCDKDPLSHALRNKICYIGHRRFLPRKHPWRRSKAFNGKNETLDRPGEFSTDELLQQLEKVKDVRPGKHPQNKKRKRQDKDVPAFSRRTVLFDLPYWSNLKLRHNLDVMHIEKNICDNLLGTLLNIEGKTKDTINARLDLQDMGIRDELHLKKNGNSYDMPSACYSLNKEQKIAFCDFLRGVKFPDGYASNLARCISADGCKVQGLKTHDCHILLQRILPAGIRGLIRKDIYEAITELGIFFRELCNRTLKLDTLYRLKEEIPIILCKLEKIFPPAFFDVMVHLAIHLPDEAILRGPVQYGWMFPIERRLCTLKRYVRNRARPEGSIAEAYIADEALTFCSRYIDDIDTRFNQEGTSGDGSRENALPCDLSVFIHHVNVLGASKLLNYGELDNIVWYVLNNCPEVEPYME